MFMVRGGRRRGYWHDQPLKNTQLLSPLHPSSYPSLGALHVLYWDIWGSSVNLLPSYDKPPICGWAYMPLAGQDRGLDNDPTTGCGPSEARRRGISLRKA